MPFEMKEQPKEKNCIYCGSPMVFQDLGKPYFIWRCTNCRYHESLVPLMVDPSSLQGLAGQL